MTKFPTAQDLRSADSQRTEPRPHAFATPHLVGIPGGVLLVFRTDIGELLLPVSIADAKALGAQLANAEYHQ